LSQKSEPRGLIPDLLESSAPVIVLYYVTLHRI
jgi:hypothetical protein